MIDIPDVNVWLALSAEKHSQHQTAQYYWEMESEQIVAFTLTTAISFLRLASNPRVMVDQALSCQQAWQRYRRIRDELGVVFLSDELIDERVLGIWAQREVTSPRLWPDAALAALAIGHGARLVTFDRDFLRFNGLDVLLLDDSRHQTGSDQG